MGGYGCPCGSGFRDYTPDQARLISEMDWENFMETVEASKLNVAWHFVKATVYQCPSCSRLLIFMRGESWGSPGAGRVYTFTPDDEESAEILRSIYGKKWKRGLWGIWEDSQGKGYVQWGYIVYPGKGDQDGDNGYVNLSCWQDVENLYHEVFQRLMNADKLGGAILRRDGEDVHTWRWRPFWREA